MNRFAGDTVVIGGGIVGSSIAFRLAEKGQKVILLEKGRVGEEASGRSAGGVRQQGRDPAELPLAMEAIKIWHNMKDELNFNVGYRRGGNIYYALSREKLDLFEVVAQREARVGLKVNILSPEETRCVTPTLSKNIKIFGAKYCQSDGTANPLLVTKAICRAALLKGVQIQEHSPVRQLKTYKRKIIAAETDSGEYKGSFFVNAAGAWARELCNLIGVDIPIVFYNARIMVTEALPPIIEQFVETDNFYYRQALEGNLHIGGQIMRDQVINIEKGVKFRDFVEVGRHLPAFLPITRKIHLIRAFGGIIHSTPDKIPILDKVPGFDNFFVTTGFSGHGFCLGPIIGKLIAEWIVDGKSSMDLRAFRYSRFGNLNLSKDFRFKFA